MRKLWLVLMMAGAMLAAPLAAPAVARADVDTYECEFMGVIANLEARDNQQEGGVESVITDLNQAETDGGGLLDEDNGTAATDGTYAFGTGVPGEPPSVWTPSCVFTDGDPLDYQGLSGYYLVSIVSGGQYNNVVCGTGDFDADPNQTAIDFFDPVTHLGSNAEAKGPLYIEPAGPIVATQSVFTIDGGHNSETPGTASGNGYLTVLPHEWHDNPGNDENADWPDTYPESTPCLDGDVNKFVVNGAFTVKVDHGS
jgi:hypothetical protein